MSWKEKWDPENDFWGNIKFGLTENGTFTRNGGRGQFYKYSTDDPNDPIIYWNSSDPSLVYYQRGNNKPVKVDVSDIDTSGGFWNYASDAQLDSILDRIVSSEQTAKLAELQQATDAVAQAAVTDESAPVTLETIVVPNQSESQEKEYQERLAEASKKLNAMMTTEDYTPKEDNTKYYKFGSNEIDFKYYLHNIGTNLQNYLDSKEWSPEQRKAFLESYEVYKLSLTDQFNSGSSRFYTDDAGILKDTSGILAGTNDRFYIDSQGNRYNSLDEITDKKLKKSAKLFSPNDEVANYFNIIGQAVAQNGKVRPENPDETFDLSNNGFVRYWVDKVAPNAANDNFDIDPYLALDPVAPDGKRKRDNRTKYFTNQLNNYYNYIKNSNFKFDDTPYKTKEDYLAKIQKAIENLNNGWDESDPVTLQAVGISADFYNKMFSEEADPLASDTDRAAADSKRKNQAQHQYIKQIQKQYDDYIANNHVLTKGHGIKYYENPKYVTDADGNGSAIMTQLSNMIGITSTDQVDILWKAMKQAIQQGNKEINFNGVTASIQTLLPVVLPLFKKILGNDERTGVLFFDEPEENLKNGTILCIGNGELYYDFIGNVKSCTAWQRLKNNFESKYNTTNEEALLSFDKKGGILRKYDEGGNTPQLTQQELEMYQQMIAEEEARQTAGQLPEAPVGAGVSDLIASGMSIGQALDQSLYGERRAEARKRGMTYEQYNASQRQLNGQADFYNKDNGVWKLEDYIRAGAILADITSIVLPVYLGAATGAAGSVANFVADWTDNSVSTGDAFKNLTLNLGMDVACLIPGLGAATKGGHLMKAVKWLVPKVMGSVAIMGGIQALANGEEILKSFKKVTSDEKLTVADWQNIALGIFTFAGASNLAKAGAIKRIAKNNASKPDAIGLGLKKKGTNQVEDFIFNGKHAEELKKLVKQGNLGEVNAYLNKLHGFENYEVNSHIKTMPIGAQSPVTRTKGDDGKTTWGVQSPVGVRRKIDSFDIYDKTKLREVWSSKGVVNTARQEAVAASKNYKEDKLFTKEDVDAQLPQLIRETPEIEAEFARSNRKKEDLEKQIAEAPAEKARMEADKADLDSRMKDIQARMRDTEGKGYHTDVFELTDFRGLLRKYSFDPTTPISVDGAIRTANNRIKKTENIISNCERTKRKIEAKLNDPKLSPKDKRDLKRRLRANDIAIENNKKQIEAIQKDITTLEEYKASKKQYEADKSDVNKQKKLDDYLKNFDKYLTEKLQTLDALNGKEGVTPIHSDLYNRIMTETTPITINFRGTPVEIGREQYRLVIKDLGLLKKGGRLRFLRGGDNVNTSNTAHNVKYDEDINYWDDFILDSGEISEEFKEVLKSLNSKEAVDNANNYLNTVYRSVFTKDNPNNPKSEIELRYDPNTRIMLNLFNSLFGVLNTRLPKISKIKTLGTTGDNLPGSYNDGYAGTYTWLRHLGNSYELVEKINNSKYLPPNVKAIWNDTTGMVNFEFIGQDTSTPPADTHATNPTQVTPEGELPPQLIRDGEISNTGGPYGENTHENNPSGAKNITGKLGEIAPDIIDQLRFDILRSSNKARAAKQIAKTVPYYKNPKTDDVLVHSDLKKEAAGNVAYAAATMPSHQALTSDASKQMAMMTEAHIKAAPMITEGLNTSSDTYRKYQEMDQIQRMKNHENEHATAEYNKEQGLKTAADKLAIELAAEAQDKKMLDTRMLEIVYKLRERQEEKKGKQDQAVYAAIKSAVENHPENYGIQFTTAEQSVWNKKLAGVSSSNLSEIELAALRTASEKVNNAKFEQIYRYEGIGGNPWSDDAKPRNLVESIMGFIPQVSDPKSHKSGGSLDVVKVRERSKNADRFQKSIQQLLDRFNKKLDRVSKKLYGLPKSTKLK